MSYRARMGDHSVVPVQQLGTKLAFFEQGSLYVLDDRRELHLLRPFLVVKPCPTCHTTSIFHVDRCTPDGVQLKSLDHGHVADGMELEGALQGVGFL